MLYNTLMDDKNGWAYQAEETMAPAQYPDVPQPTESQPISWTGSEYVARQKSAGWFIILFAGLAVLCGGIYLLWNDLIAPIAIFIAGLLFAVIANRAPRQRSFMIDSKGITVDSKFYSYSEFKSFTLLQDDAMGYIDLIPLKRFMPEISLYYAPNDEQQIFETLALHLPHEERDEHRVDKLMRKIKF